jgi:aspartyl protease family protein
MNRLFAIAFAAIVAMGALAAAFSPDEEPGTKPVANFVESAESDESDGTATVIRRDASGQFHLTAAVNGEDARFLVDTGADVVALTVDEAERLGITVAAEDFEPMMQTASGVGNGAVVTIETLAIGSSEFHDVQAVVAEGLTVNLLGQSVLRSLGKVEMQGDKMVLRHR